LAPAAHVAGHAGRATAHFDARRLPREANGGYGKRRHKPGRRGTNAVEEALDMHSATLVPVGFNGTSEHTAYAATGMPRWVVLVFGYVVARIVN
jgi:hypothetical protein